MRVLIAGAGISGLATAVSLSEAGHDVTVLERSAEQHGLGSGITLIAPAIRALDTLGIYDECIREGFGVTQFQENDWHGTELRVVDLPSATGEGGPGMLGMMRPTLHRLLIERAVASGARIRWDSEVVSVLELDERVSVELIDGTRLEAELLVGADGLRSTIRRLVFGDFEIQFQRQGCFRAVVRRPAEITKETDFGGYPGVHPGFTPLSSELMYIYCTAAADDTSLIPPHDIPGRMRELLQPFGGAIEMVRDQITDPERVNYRPFETILVPPPWNRGRVVLVGDSAHSTTPHLAAGGAMCLEDALVLAEELDGDLLLDSLDRYTARRFPRASFVVETSVKLASWQLDGSAALRDPSSLKIEARALLAEAY